VQLADHWVAVALFLRYILLYVSRDLVDDACVPANIAIPQPVPKAAPRHVKKFRICYTCGKGFIDTEHFWRFQSSCGSLSRDCRPASVNDFHGAFLAFSVFVWVPVTRLQARFCK
jgi:hypothetical protein